VPVADRAAFRVWGYLLACSAAWGASYPLVRYVVATMPPLSATAARVAIATLAMAAFLLLTRQTTRPDRATVRHAVVFGMIQGVLPLSLMAMAMGRIAAAPAALIGAATPLIVALATPWLLREERPTSRGVAGLLLGFVGIAALIGPAALRADASLAGGLLVLGMSACYAASTLYARIARITSSAPLALGQQAASLPVALVLALAIDPPGSFDQGADVWAVLVVVGMVASAVALTLYLRLLSFARATEAAMVSYLQPVWAAGIAALVLGEVPGMHEAAAGAVVLAGVWLVGTQRRGGGERLMPVRRPACSCGR